MGLDFINQNDREGAAVIILHNGSQEQTSNWERFSKDVNTEGNNIQVYIYCVEDREGEELRDFYDLPIEDLPHVLLVRDDDEIAYSWCGTTMPTIQDVTYLARQIG